MAHSHYVQLPHCNGTDNHLPTVIARRVPIHWSWITSVLRRVCNALGARIRYRQKTCRYSGAFGFHLVPCRYRETIARQIAHVSSLLLRLPAPPASWQPLRFREPRLSLPDRYDPLRVSSGLRRASILPWVDQDLLSTF